MNKGNWVTQSELVLLAKHKSSPEYCESPLEKAPVMRSRSAFPPLGCHSFHLLQGGD